MSPTAKKHAYRTAQFCSGGAAYGILELLWRGYTHISMLILGGMCFVLLIRISRLGHSLTVKALTGGLCVTAAEFATGCVVNLWLGLSVWDYSNEPCQLMGQICIRFTLLWTLLCFAILPLCRSAASWPAKGRVILRRLSQIRSLRRLGTAGIK